MQQTLFNNFQANNSANQPNITPADIRNFSHQIPNLVYKVNYISQEKEIKILQWIDSNEWLIDLKRRATLWLEI